MTPVKRAQAKLPETSRLRFKASRSPDPAARPPAAGAHAAHHLINEEATPGAGALTSPSHRAHGEVDGGAG